MMSDDVDRRLVGRTFLPRFACQALSAKPIFPARVANRIADWLT